MPEIMSECLLPWTLNGVAQRPFLCSPAHAQELIRGHLLGLGVSGKSLLITGDGEHTPILVETPELPASTDILCAPPRCESDLALSAKTLRALCDELMADVPFGMHRVMLWQAGGSIQREDVGRHNAADKCIGYMDMQGWDASRCVMGCTGRCSLEMLLKAARVGIPIFFTPKYPSDLAIKWAEQAGVAIVARANRESSAIYGATWRIREGGTR